MRIKKVDIYIKFVCNCYCFLQFYLLKKKISLGFHHAIYS